MARQTYMTLARLTDLSGEELKAEWARRYGAPAPSLSADLLRLGIGYKLQEQRLGGVSRPTRMLLQQLAARAKGGSDSKPIPLRLMPGTRLVRDWHGVGHTVIVLEKGFDYNGKEWKSLSAIAAAITGTKWNGPLFFGLTARPK